MVSSKRGRGAPTRYKQEYAKQANKLCLLGATDKELGEFFGVSAQTINAWKKSQPDFLDSITRGKTLADANVAEKLYKRALGYKHQAVKIFNEKGEALIVPYTERFPPDTQAASLWLRNRQPNKWRGTPDGESTDDLAGAITKLIERLPS